MLQELMLNSISVGGVDYSGVHPKDLDLIWPYVAPMLERALAYFDDRLSINDIYDGIETGSRQLFIIVRAGKLLAAVTTSILIYPRKKIFSIDFLAGKDMKAWFHGFFLLKNYAIGNGCSAIEIHGRPGWTRILKDFRILNITQVLDL